MRSSASSVRTAPGRRRSSISSAATRSRTRAASASTGSTSRRWRRRSGPSAGLVRRFQDARLFPSLTVYETLLVSLEQRLEVKSSILNAVAAAAGAPGGAPRSACAPTRLLELLELGAYRDKFVKELSTGLRRIVDLACVLATEPKVLLLDEPSSGIAQAEAEGLAPLLRRIRYETGCSILIIEHDMPLISAVSDELLALDRGAVVMPRPSGRGPQRRARHRVLPRHE